jgi:GGDEF domain-containing protein
MLAAALGRGRSRPVADTPALDGAAVAKAWLVELVARAPLERAAQVPGRRFADDAPRLGAAVAAALSSDAALADLEPDGTLAPLAAGAGLLAGAAAPSETVTALDALRAATWAALLDAAARPAAAQIADLADRLAAVIATITAAALDTPHPLGPPRPGDRGPLAAVLRDARAEEHAEPAPEGDPTPPVADDVPPGEEAARPEAASQSDAGPPRNFGAPPDAAAPRDPDVPSGAPRLCVVPPEPSAGEALAEIERTLRDAASAADPLAAAAERLRALAREPAPEGLAVRAPHDELRAARLAPWTSAIERRVAVGRPFAVLLVEVADLDRLLAADHDREVAAALERAEEALVEALRPADALVRERPGRYWLTTPDTEPAAARDLAHRLAAAVAGLPPLRGVPLQLVAGLAGCPADAQTATELEALAEQALFAARAAGVPVAGPGR